MPDYLRPGEGGAASDPTGRGWREGRVAEVGIGRWGDICVNSGYTVTRGKWGCMCVG